MGTRGYLKGPWTPFELIIVWLLDAWSLLIALIPVLHCWIWSLKFYLCWSPSVWVQSRSLLCSVPFSARRQRNGGALINLDCAQRPLKAKPPWNWNFVPDLTSQLKAPLLPPEESTFWELSLYPRHQEFVSNSVLCVNKLCAHCNDKRKTVWIATVTICVA